MEDCWTDERSTDAETADYRESEAIFRVVLNPTSITYRHLVRKGEESIPLIINHIGVDL